jgi:hypothetical protein
MFCHRVTETQRRKERKSMLLAKEKTGFGFLLTKRVAFVFLYASVPLWRK